MRKKPEKIWTPGPGGLGPVKSYNAHPETDGDTEQLVDDVVLRLCPADGRESGECGHHARRPDLVLPT